MKIRFYCSYNQKILCCVTNNFDDLVICVGIGIEYKPIRGLNFADKQIQKLFKHVSKVFSISFIIMCKMHF